MTDQLVFTLASGVLVAAASGLVGSFLVLRKMTLLSDALSHVALPGIALGVLFHFDPLLGGLCFLFAGVLLIWYIEMKTKLAVESITGVLFVTALAIGALLIPQTELLETFFGNVERITFLHAVLQSTIALLIIAVTLKYLKPLILVSIAPDLSVAANVNEAKMHLLLLTLITFTIAIGISFVGILLMSALSIIPAVTARNFSKNFKTFVVVSVVIAVLSLEGGLFASHFWLINPGIATVLISATLFTTSLLKKQR